MKEKLLALLVSKFAGVSEATLERIATKKAGSVTDESQLQSIVDGIDFGFVVQSEVDSKVTIANQKAIQNYEATHKLKDGKPVSEPPAPGTPPAPSPDVPEWAKSIIETNKALQTKLETYEKKEAQTGYFSKVKTALSEKKVPESFWSKRHLNVESDEQLNTVISEIETDWTTFRQEQINAGVMIDKPAAGSPENNDVKSIVNQIEAGTKAIVESKK